MDLSTFIDKNGCECLNESDGHTLPHALTNKGGFLESDCDEQVSHANMIECVLLHTWKCVIHSAMFSCCECLTETF